MTSQNHPISNNVKSFYPSFGIEDNSKDLVSQWMKLRKKLIINGSPFSEMLKHYNLNKPESYQETKVKRFEKFLSETFINHLLGANDESQKYSEFLPTLEKWLSQSGLVYSWANTLLNRLKLREYEIEGEFNHTIDVSLSNDNEIQIRHYFQFVGTAIWHNLDYDPQDKEDKKTYCIAENSSRLFEGESVISIYVDNGKLTFKNLKAESTLYATAMRKPFITPSLDEQINQHISETQPPEEEKNVLEITKQYYLGLLDYRQLQTTFVSTNFYDKAFEDSKTHKLIEQVLNEKPPQKNSNDFIE